MAAGAHLRTILSTAVQEGIAPGVIVVAGSGGEMPIFEVVGSRQIEPSRLPLDRQTVWDLASLTKPLVTALLTMQAVQSGVLDLDEPIGAAPADADPASVNAMTVRRVLAHAAGFVAHLPLWAGALRPQGPKAGDAEARAAIVAAAAGAALAYPPGSRSIYSDLGFILLGDRLEQRLGDRLDRLAATRLPAPFGTEALAFRPIGEASSVLPLAPTENCPVRGRLLVGEVHDLNAYAMAGVAGHAGLFGTADAVVAVVRALLAAYRGAGPAAGVAPIVDRSVLRTFWTAAGIPGSTWRLGWDGPSQEGSLAGDRIARTAVGHLAFTGCSLWIDPEREAFVLMLSNRVHPRVREDAEAKAGLRVLRRAVNDAALDALGYRA
jgi:serine-type D-Ala-D-Ala carboxypeptidase